MSISRLLTVVVLVGLAGLSAVAGEGRTPIWTPVVIGPGMEGQYILTRDITGAGGPAIDILPGTGQVEIDLNGFTAFGDPAGGHVINIVATATAVVRNGSIRGTAGTPGDGIHAEEVDKLVVEDVKLRDNGDNGMGLFGVLNFALRRNIVLSPGRDGIFIDGSPLGVPVDGTIEGNVLRDCENGIQLIFGSSVGIINNRFEAMRANGIWVTPGPNPYGCIACLINENTVQEASNNGMWLQHFENSKVYNNTVTFSGTEGIWLDVLSDDNLVLDNVSSQNGFNGLLVDSLKNHLERNVLNDNGLSGGVFWGMHLRGGGNVYRGNMARGNPGGAAACGALPATTDFCDATGGTNTSPFVQPAAGMAGDNLMPGLL